MELAAALGVIAFAIMVAIQVQQGRAMRDELANVASVILREQQQLGHRVSSARIMAEHAAARALRARIRPGRSRSCSSSPSRAPRASASPGTGSMDAAP